MSIQPISSIAGASLNAGAAEAPGEAVFGRPSAAVAAGRRTDEWQESPELAELKRVFSSASMDIQFEVRPGTSDTIVRIVDPASGQVVHEFPPARVADALDELSARFIERLRQHA